MSRLSYTKFVVFLAFVLGCDVVSSQSLIPFRGKVTRAYNDTIECDSEFTCDETKCNEGKLCVQLGDRWVQYATITCDETTNERYCNRGTCSEEPPPHCERSFSLLSEFTCPMVDGVYPDPSSCRRYHICVRGVRRTNICPANNVYDHRIGECKYQNYFSDCVLFRCSNRDGQPIVYPRDNSIYGRCYAGKVNITGRCQKYERYNLFTEKCERYCRSVSTQPPYPGNCGKYILCAEVAPRRYQQVEMSCGCDHGYDEEENRCVLNAPCVKDSPETWCTPRNNEGEPNGWSDNSNDNDDFGKNVNQTTEAPATVVNNVENSNSSDNQSRQSKNSKSKNTRRSIPNKQNNNTDFDVSIVPPTLIIDNLSDNINNVNGNEYVDGNLINADNNGNNDNDEIPEIKQRENFVRYVFNWIIRIIVGQNE